MAVKGRRRLKVVDIPYQGHNYYYKRVKKPKTGNVIMARYQQPIKTYNIVKRKRVFKNISNKYRQRIDRKRNERANMAAIWRRQQNRRRQQQNDPDFN